MEHLNPFSLKPSSRMGVVISLQIRKQAQRHGDTAPTEQQRCSWAVSRPYLDGLEKLEGPCSVHFDLSSSDQPGYIPPAPQPWVPSEAPTTPVQKPAPAPRVTWQVNGHSPVASLGQPV